MFKKILIANRGAIAVRIERTLKRLGIKSVAIYTEADQDSLHVDNADEVVLIGSGVAKDSYLNEELILEKALELGVEAIHPGYGFLSENSDFARRCIEKGIIFIGPTPEQMEMFGLKHLAREIAKKSSVPLLEGTGLLNSIEEALKAADEIGYPVILKSTAGGGGIGMKICKDKEELESAYNGVKYLAGANFKNEGIFLEKYIEKARHIEVQIFGNAFGEIIALGERDCSIQRRNQKVVEESPAPNLPNGVREKMLEAATRLAKEADYKSAGTVEFLYDPKEEKFYFLEVNTRLQVEHGITEEVFGVDLVEWMVKEAANELTDLKSLVRKPQGHSIEARIYAEDCYHDFRPSAGKVDKVVFSKNSRNETWVRDEIVISSFYDPMMAKIIVHGNDRKEAIKKLKNALDETRMYGITTNIEYVSALLGNNEYKEGNIFTALLKDFRPRESAIEVIDGGLQTTVQDFPGRVGYWGVGVPPCGPMDPYSFRIGNKILGNNDDASGLELTLKGGEYFFRDDVCFCITGANMKPTLDGMEIPMYTAIYGKSGQILRFQSASEGMRAYLLVEGGFDMPKILGSSSTFTLGGFGGHGGRVLRSGDVLRLNKLKKSNMKYEMIDKYKEKMSNVWEIGVIPGPHSSKEFLSEDYLNNLTSKELEVHFNSSRTGVRLIGDVPTWNREDGGEAGLHPSNIHDNAYAVGTLDLTGDMAILLGPDGPSLGGFVCPVTVATAEFWKIGQLHPGDKVKFKIITLEEAAKITKVQENKIKAIEERQEVDFGFDLTDKNETNGEYPILIKQEEGRDFSMTIRCAGDENLLVEYGEMELDLMLRFQVHILMEALEKDNIIPIKNLTPGIRSLQINIDSTKITIKEALNKVVETENKLPPLHSITVPSRIVNLPLSWDDPATRLAIERYQKNVRPDAPWCPSNLEFIRRINGLDTIEDVKKIVFDANYLVLGLGDVYLGAPVATPVDPRHRLVTTKYNPARTWTPENAVGIGGAYMCVYGMEGPGGYQFVGRTIQMWNKVRETNNFKKGKPWLLNFFDQIRFYPVEADELLKLREDFLRGRFEPQIEETSFDLGKYMEFLKEIEESAKLFKEHQQKSFNEERERWKKLGLAEYVSENSNVEESVEEKVPENRTGIYSQMHASVWKVLVKPGDRVKKGDTLIIEESMKMEINIECTCNGIIDKVYIEPGDEVQPGQVLISIEEE